MSYKIIDNQGKTLAIILNSNLLLATMELGNFPDDSKLIQLQTININLN